MRRTLPKFLLVAAVATLSYGGTLQFTPIPSDGVISGLPGTEPGWGFEVDYIDNGTPTWAILNASTFSGSQRFGTYIDFVSLNTYIFDPLTPSVRIGFDPSTFSGLGAFQIDPVAPFGLIPGSITIFYATFSQDPNDPAFDPGSFVGSFTATVNADVDVAPEPVSLLLLGAALPLAYVFRRRRRSA